MKKTMKNLSLSSKKILLRVDFNVPIKNSVIQDTTRIDATLPTIKYILQQNASLILISHLGRPKGKYDQSLSLKPIKEYLSKKLPNKIFFSDDCIGKKTKELAKNLKPKEILLLENLRFHIEEEKPSDDTFAKELASLADIYVNDAFSVSHRKHSSVYAITKYFSESLMGFLMEKEISSLKNYLFNPKRPFFAIIAGAKISTKISLILKLIHKADELFIAGGMAYTFFKALGKNIGKSLVENDQIQNIQEAFKISKKNHTPINLPLDIVIADKFDNSANKKIISSSEDIPPDWEGMDIGPKTISSWEEKLQKAKTIFWNGPLGVFEMENFSKGTQEIAKTLAKSSAITIAGGGDSISAINKLHLKDKFTHISTGGGASLEFIEKETLPGIEALTDL